MRKTVLLATLVLIYAGPAFAFSSPWDKLSTGAKEIATGPLKIITVPVQHIDEAEHDHILHIIGGLLEGATQTVVTTLRGLFNIVTFPLVDPEYSLE